MFNKLNKLFSLHERMAEETHNNLDNLDKFQPMRNSLNNLSNKLEQLEHELEHELERLNNFIWDLDKPSHLDTFDLNMRNNLNSLNNFKSNRKISLQQEKEEREFTKWLDEAISKGHLKYHQYQSFGDHEEIGDGSFGIAYKAYNKNYMKYMVLKALKINNSPSEKIAKQIVNELQQHREVDMHDNVIGFYGVTKNDSNEYMLVMEYANDETLHQYLSKNFSKMNWNLKLKFAKQISSAVFCLHENNIIHGDLHPENIFVHSGNIKIGDFGLSKSIINATLSSAKAFGAIRYSDPEYLKDPNNYQRTKVSDVYSVGVLLWEISSGRSPFQGIGLSKLFFEIADGHREKTIPGTPKFYIDVYRACWNADPKKRPEMSDVIQLLDKIDMNVSTKCRSHF